MTLQPFRTLFVTVAALVTLGCANEDYSSISSKYASEGESVADMAPPESVASTADTASIDAMEAAAPQTVTPDGGDPDPQQGTASDTTLDRKIIYDSTMGLVVDDYAQFESRLPELVTKYGGFIATSDTDRRYRDQQTGTWVVRIPVVHYTDFLSGVSSLGFAESRSENARDVTEEYVDVEARILNKRALETRILSILDERTGKLSDVLEIERELARVREEIERMEGRLRFLKDRTTLATVTITCREQKEYQPAEAPTFASRIRQSWSHSLGSMRATGESVVVGVIAIVPWLVVIMIPLWVIARVIKRKRSS
jgi:hypothetical protein